MMNFLSSCIEIGNRRSAALKDYGEEGDFLQVFIRQ